VNNREMIYPFTNLLFGIWVHGNQRPEKGMMRFWDCHLERLTIQQIINEMTGVTPRRKSPLPDC